MRSGLSPLASREGEVAANYIFIRSRRDAAYGAVDSDIKFSLDHFSQQKLAHNLKDFEPLSVGFFGHLIWN